MTDTEPDGALSRGVLVHGIDLSGPGLQIVVPEHFLAALRRMSSHQEERAKLSLVKCALRPSRTSTGFVTRKDAVPFCALIGAKAGIDDCLIPREPRLRGVLTPARVVNHQFRLNST